MCQIRLHLVYEGKVRYFADEIFRVFRNEHPEFELVQVNADTIVMQMTKRAIVAQQNG